MEIQKALLHYKSARRALHRAEAGFIAATVVAALLLACACAHQWRLAVDSELKKIEVPMEAVK